MIKAQLGRLRLVVVPLLFKQTNTRTCFISGHSFKTARLVNSHCLERGSLLYSRDSKMQTCTTQVLRQCRNFDVIADDCCHIDACKTEDLKLHMARTDAIYCDFAKLSSSRQIVIAI
jgi:hypothetical protein